MIHCLTKTLVKLLAVLVEAVACAASAQASSQHSASQSSALLAQQRALVHELATAHEASQGALGLLAGQLEMTHGQLRSAHGSLNEAEVERKFLGRQVLAASALARLEVGAKCKRQGLLMLTLEIGGLLKCVNLTSVADLSVGTAGGLSYSSRSL